MTPDQRAAAAAQYFDEGYNCSQSVALAFADVLEEKTGLDRKAVADLASAFGGGFGRQREVCGSVSGMTLAAGAVLPSDPSDQNSRTACYAFEQKLCARFREEHGSIICRELLGLRAGQKETPEPSARTPEFYHARPCQALVASAARILAEELEQIRP